MQDLNSLEKNIGDGASTLAALYADGLEAAQVRCQQLLSRFREAFPEVGEAAFFSTPGRTELCGNHTDHEGGHVLCAAVDLDVLALAGPCAGGSYADGDVNHVQPEPGTVAAESGLDPSPTEEAEDEAIITVLSEGYAPICVGIGDLRPREGERNSSAALIRGICARFVELGFTVGGFCAVMHSTVRKGSGLSSSAAFEVEIASILNHLYNGGRIDGVTLAQVAQYAENQYFGKPCGLMDMCACAVGGCALIDFEKAETPGIQHVSFDFANSGYTLFIAEVGGSHADLTAEYAAVPEEMQAVARALGGRMLRDISEDAFFGALPWLQETLQNDRAILRAFHYFSEERHTLKAAAYLEQGDMEGFLGCVNTAADSAWKCNQNYSLNSSPESQEIPVALSVVRHLLNGRGAARMQGGGFGGTIQCYVPTEEAERFAAAFAATLPGRRLYPVRIRQEGAVKL